MHSSKKIMALKVGTRGSQLALTQTGMMVAILQNKFPGLKIKTVVIKTLGDKIVNAPLSKIGEKGLFIKEIESALDRKSVV